MRNRAHSMRERLQRASLDRDSKGKQPDEVIDEKPSGARVRIHGTEHGGLGVQRRGNGEGKSQHRDDKLGVQHVQAGPD